MHRFFTESISDGRAFLSEEDSHHALRVLRLSEGEEIELVCAPERYLAEIVGCDADGVSVRVKQTLPQTEAQTRVTLYQGLPKADKMELIVQKSTELGAYAIAPVAMERSVVKLDGKDAVKKTERWQKIAREAVKQCARVQVPQVCLPRRLKELEAEFAALDVLIVPWEEARDGSIRQVLAPFAEKKELSVGILIGPEGGISEKEAQWLSDVVGGRLVTLGPRILRTETAGLCALAVTMALRGELE